MNKNQFLAELKRLLSYMTPEDRSAALDDYANRFDSAGEDGTSALLAEIGTPTKVAITLSRSYTPGCWANRRVDAETADTPEADIAESVSSEAAAENESANTDADGAAPMSADEPAAAPEVSADAALPQYDSSVPAEEASVIEADETRQEAEPAEVSDSEAAAEDTDSSSETDDMISDISSAVSEAIGSEKPEESAITPENSTQENMPDVLIQSEPINIPAESSEACTAEDLPSEKSGGQSAPGSRKALCAILSVVPGIPLLAILAAVMIVLVLPGCACIGAAVLIGIGGLWAAPITVDALLFYGAALCVLAVGLLLLWLGLWLDIRIASWFFLNAKNIGRRLLGREIKEIFALPACTTAWKIFLWISFVLFAVGLALLAVALFSGAGISSVRNHGNVAGYADALRANYNEILNFLK